MPVVSVVITCFNQGRFLEHSVNSVMQQTLTDLECLIVDDGSTDITRHVAKSLVKIDPRIKYFYKQNGGVSSARNFGFDQAQGEWIQFLDADDWIDEDKLRFQLSHLEKLDENIDPSADLVFYSDYDRVYINEEQTVLSQERKQVGALDRQQLMQRLLVPDFLADSPFPVLQQCLLMKRTVFAKKRFNEELKALQDRDFPLALLAAGVEFVYTPIVGAFYTKHQSNRTNNWNYMKGYYLLLYETLFPHHQDLMKSCQVGLAYLLDEAIREQEPENFERLLKLVQFPIKLADGKLTVYHPAGLKLIYQTRPLVPNWLVHPKYRGPRTEKLLATFNKFTQFSRPSQTQES
jgi:glycosyltransferase involved in cell wall biosynthesis